MVKCRRDLTGVSWYGLTAIKRDEEKTEQKGRSYWVCKCDYCGKEMIRPVDYFSSKRKTVSCGCAIQRTVDETGKRYGRLVVISRNLEKHNRTDAYWNCLCDCGKETVVSTDSLHSGKTVSCGCKGREFYKFTSKILKNEIGNRYGALVVIKRDKEKKDSSAWWICQCDCGKVVSCRGANLRAGYNISCGCRLPSMGETTIEVLLKEKRIKYKTQYVIPNFRYKITHGNPYFDFAIFSGDKLAFLLEYNGIQHYEYVEYFKEPLENIQSRDNQKVCFCEENNIPLEVIPYTEINNLDTIIDKLLKKYNLYGEE